LLGLADIKLLEEVCDDHGPERATVPIARCLLLKNKPGGELSDESYQSSSKKHVSYHTELA